MKSTTVTDRLTFLAEQFDIFECDIEENAAQQKIAELKADGFDGKAFKNSQDNVIGLISTKINDRGRTLKKVSIFSGVFVNMLESDPTDNKIYLQWMLNLFSQMLKNGDEQSLTSALRLVEEDLPQAKVYLMLFEDNKRKKKFKDLCLNSYSLKHVSDPTNINQYKSLSQLFDAVDPFIEREPSAVEMPDFVFRVHGFEY
jgi:hypothetical protein